MFGVWLSDIQEHAGMLTGGRDSWDGFKDEMRDLKLCYTHKVEWENIESYF